MSRAQQGAIEHGDAEAPVATCPRCHSRDLRRSRTRRWEATLRWLTGLVPYRCRSCRWRGWRPADWPIID